MSLNTIDLDLTNNCVLACDYCFRGAKNQRRLSLETGKAAINWFIKESGNNKKLSVALFGGEPLMEFELIKQLVPYGQEQAQKAGKSMHFSATTNSVLVNDEMIDSANIRCPFILPLTAAPNRRICTENFPMEKVLRRLLNPKLKRF
jgi:uncharacterized protein